MTITHENRIGVLFGLFGSVILCIILFFVVIFTKNYSPFIHTVSSLGNGNMKLLFSVGFITAGASGIPFVVHLNKELINLNKKMRKITHVLAIVSNICIALVGVIPDEVYINAFTIFHGVVAVVSFVGTSIYITLYSILIHKHSGFKKYLSYFGFSIGILLILLGITLEPILEWMLTISIITWTMITAIQCVKK